MKLAYLGPGIPLLFSFIQNSLIFLVVLTVIFAAFAIYSNVVGDFCSMEGMCSTGFLDFIDKVSIYNKSTSLLFLSIQNYTLLAFSLLSIFIMHYFRYKFRIIEDECDDMINTPSDYAVILRRLPEDTSKEDLEKMVEERRGTLTEE